MKLFAAALALTLGLAGCGPVDGDPIRSGGAAASDSAPRPDAVTVAQLRQQAEQNGSLAAVLYLGSVPERTADVDAALDSLQEQPWQFVADIPADHRVTAPGGGRELYCIFAVRSRDTLFLYEKQDPQYPHQTGRELYCKQDGQPILLLCNGTPDTPDITAVVYCTTGRASSSKPEKMLDGDNMIASPSAKQEYTEPEDVTYMRLLAGEDEYRACVLYLGGSYEITTDVQQVLDSQQGLRELWGFVYDIPQDHWVVAPDGGCDLYCIFPQEAQATLFVYETSLTDDAENPLQRGKQLYYSEDGQPILLLCNISDIVPNTEVELYPTAGEELVFSPFLSGENGHVVEAEGVCDFTIYPEGDDWETTTSPWSLEGNWLETARDTDEGFSETAPEDADRMCFLPTDADTEGSQLPFTASYITPYPELNVEEADLFYQEGTPEVPFQTNQEWYATFTGEDGSRYAVTLEDEDTLALKVYLDGEESYMSLVNTVYFARQEAMG